MLKFLFKLTGIVIFIYSLIMSIVMNFNLGVIACFFIGVFFIAIGFLRKIGTLIKFMFFGIIILGIASSLLYAYGHNDTITYNEDALIILGAGINGERVTYPLAKRLDEGIVFHEKNPTGLIIVTGGQGVQEDITEALAMERYLLSKGVDGNIIIKEEKATSTYENFVNSKEILDVYFEDEYTVGFATTDFHVYRANLISKTVGYNATHVNSRSQNFSIPVNYTREVMAIIKYYIFKN